MGEIMGNPMFLTLTIASPFHPHLNVEKGIEVGLETSSPYCDRTVIVSRTSTRNEEKKSAICKPSLSGVSFITVT